MEISIAELKQGANHFRVEENWQSLQISQDRFPGAITINSLADLEGNLLTVKHHLQTRAQLSCDRCLSLCEQELDLQERYLFVIDPHRDYGEDIVVVHTQDQYINLNDGLRDMLVLALPMRQLCREDCQGLCPVCGINRNQGECQCHQEVDNSLQVALDQLKKNADSKDSK